MSNVLVSNSAIYMDTSIYPDLRETLQTVVIQNLGPDDLYLDYVSDLEELTSESGIKLVPDGIWEIQRYDSSRPLALVSVGTSDVRVLAFD